MERGIGETRIAWIEDGEIREARILLDGVVEAGTLLQARLESAGRPAVAVADGREYLLPSGAPGITEGAAFTMEVSREAIPGAEPWKRPLGRVAGTDAMPPVRPAGTEIAFPAPEDRLAEAGWDELIAEARDGIVSFPGGELRIALTPAMTLIDVDGRGEAGPLAVAAAAAAGRAIRRHGIGGSIGIDFPTVAGKGARQAIAEAIDSHLPQPFERTAVNGFGFLQIVRPRRHASLLELAADRTGFEARALLRRAARERGAIRIAAHPAIVALLTERPGWTQALARQVGGAVALRSDAALPISGGYAERC